MIYAVDVHRVLLCEDILGEVLAASVLSAGDMARFALVHSGWLGEVRHALYRSIRTTMPCPPLTRTMNASPVLRGLVRELSIHLNFILDDHVQLLEDSLSWVPRTALRALVVHCDGGLAGDTLASHLQVWKIPTLRSVSLEGFGLKVKIPAGVASLKLVGFTMVRLHHMPPKLQRFTYVRSTGLQLDVVRRYFDTLTDLHLELGNGQSIDLYDSDPIAAAWDWPRYNSLRRLTIICSEPLFLKLGSMWLRITFLRISVRLLETNAIPQTVEVLELVSPGIFTADLVHRLLVYEGGEYRRPVLTRLSKLHIETAFHYDAVGMLRRRGVLVTIED